MEGEVNLIQTWKIGTGTYYTRELARILVEDLIDDMKRLIEVTSPDPSSIVQMLVFDFSEINDIIVITDRHLRTRDKISFNDLLELCFAITDFEKRTEGSIEVSNIEVIRDIIEICEEHLD